ncbi:transposase family protein [Lentzea sp. DG1S-22]|uniref:transposase family protein n=1 Tax=Lentzea sp. DG1S-22 TaxID=3108822 RepID=UPI003FA534CC
MRGWISTTSTRYCPSASPATAAACNKPRRSLAQTVVTESDLRVRPSPATPELLLPSLRHPGTGPHCPHQPPDPGAVTAATPSRCRNQPACNPGNRNDCRAYTESRVDEQRRGAKVMADDGYQGNPEVIMPYRKPRKGQPPLPQWKEDLNTVHKSVRARLEHALAHMKSWNILRDCRHKRDGVWHATRGIAHMRNLAMTG